MQKVNIIFMLYKNVFDWLKCVLNFSSDDNTQKVDLRRTFHFDTWIHPLSTWIYQPVYKLRKLTSTIWYATGKVENGFKQIGSF
jgi:hypothetical protein